VDWLLESGRKFGLSPIITGVTGDPKIHRRVRHHASCGLAMGKPATDAVGWARRCRIESARAIHPTTRAFLDELAAHFEQLAGSPAEIDPDDPDLQQAVADRLAEVAAREWVKQRAH